MTGRFIVLYGPNNLGKSEQVSRLASNLMEHGLKTTKIKYPIYETDSGRKIYDQLRVEKTMSDLELQHLFAQNRYEFQESLGDMLDLGNWIVAEDYKHTGIIWGIVSGIDREEMLKMNENQTEPDLAVLLDGERFTSGIERGHRYEDGGKWDTARRIHLEFARELDWPTVNANQTREKVAEDIWALVTKKFSLDK